MMVLTILATTTTLLLAKKHLCLHYLVKCKQNSKAITFCTLYYVEYILGAHVLNVAGGGESM